MRNKHFPSISLQSALYDDIDLSNLSVAECSTKNINHSFQVSALSLPPLHPGLVGALGHCGQKIIFEGRVGKECCYLYLKNSGQRFQLRRLRVLPTIVEMLLGAQPTGGIPSTRRGPPRLLLTCPRVHDGGEI